MKIAISQSKILLFPTFNCFSSIIFHDFFTFYRRECVLLLKQTFFSCEIKKKYEKKKPKHLTCNQRDFDLIPFSFRRLSNRRFFYIRNFSFFHMHFSHFLYFPRNKIFHLWFSCNQISNNIFTKKYHNLKSGLWSPIIQEVWNKVE